jgi:formamidopyrimidine-DNA glycosylase
VYLEALDSRIMGARLDRVRVRNPFLVRSVDPPLDTAGGRRVESLGRMGKRIVIGLEGQRFLVLHLMIAGRLRWRPAGDPIPGKYGLAAFDFSTGTLLLTEAGAKRRAAVHLVAGAAALAALDPGGLEVMDATLEAFDRAIRRENHTLKRALTDPRILSGIGNAYSDEILHAARLSPLKQTAQLSAEEVDRLFHATRDTLRRWTERLRAETGDRFPEQVTAFRDGMAVHGRYRQPCPVCGAPIQRIAHSENEINYCPVCQTGGRLLADRAWSRLLRSDFPRTLDELEQMIGERKRRHRSPRG